MFWIKILLTTLLVTGVALLSRHNLRLAAFVGSLPWIAILVLCWLYFDQKTGPEMAQYCRLTFLFVLPSLPLFLTVATLLERGVSFPLALFAGSLSTLLCVPVVVLLAKAWDLELFL